MAQCSKARLVSVRLVRDGKEKFATVAVPLDQTEKDFLDYARWEHPRDEVTIYVWGRGVLEDGEPTIYIANMEDT